MGFHATTRDVGEVTIVDLEGELSFQEAGVLRAMIVDLMSRGRKYFLLNLRELRHLDSSGIGELARAYVAVRKRDGELKLAHLSPHVAEILRVVRLNTILEDFDDEDAALGSFR